MSLLSIVEPAGALLTGWNLVPRDTPKALVAPEGAEPSPPDGGGRKVDRPDPRSRWELGEVG